MHYSLVFLPTMYIERLNLLNRYYYISVACLTSTVIIFISHLLFVYSPSITALRVAAKLYIPIAI